MGLNDDPIRLPDDEGDEGDDGDDGPNHDLNLFFADPPGYYPPTPPPTTEQHALGRSGVQLTLHLVGHSVLEAHRLWNGSRVLADYLEEQQAAYEAHPHQTALSAAAATPTAAHTAAHTIRGKTVLELGAGAGLPGIVCGLVLGARKVVVTDYPDPDLVDTLRQNIAEGEAAAVRQMGVNPALAAYAGPGTLVADGLVWGGDPAPILRHLEGVVVDEDVDDNNKNNKTSSPGFDVVLLADLLFRHAEHAKLAASVAQTLRREAASRAYVFFTSYRPWLRHKDLAFFEHARAAGLVVEHLRETRLADPPLFFPDDPGDAGVRSTVSGYALRWPVDGEDPAAFWPPPAAATAEEREAGAGSEATRHVSVEQGES